MLKRYFPFHTFIFFFALSLAVLLLVLRWVEYRFVFLHNRYDYYSAVIAVVFMGLGIWIMKVWSHTVQIQKLIKDESEVKNSIESTDKFGLSIRELEVLHLISKGFSNQEIADQLFVSLNTIKTHTSNILSKLEVKRRTQAVDAARRSGIIS